MGFRHYFDGRNCRDVFGKRIPDLVLDTVGIRPDGTPGDTYHVLRPWGRDIMSAANSFGASMFAAVAAGIYTKIEDAQQAMGQGFAKEYQPNHENHLAYLALYEKYRKLGNFTENELFHG